MIEKWREHRPEFYVHNNGTPQEESGNFTEGTNPLEKCFKIYTGIQLALYIAKYRNNYTYNHFLYSSRCKSAS